MERRLNFGQYRAMDLTIFAVLLIVFESLASRAAIHFSSQPYFISVVPAIVCIVFMRWGMFGCIHAALGGLVYCISTRGGAVHFLIYMVGNLLSAMAVPYLRRIGPAKVRGSVALSLVMAVLVSFLMQIGRGIVAAIVGHIQPRMVFSFVLTDVISGLFAVVIVLIVRRLDGVFEDQRSYLRRINEEEAKDKEEGFDEG
ncbi:MAG: hypothetical protein IJ863_04235 [Spirochaetales bacterium]|nr:hypothetical protein [Spirochaetales bacterium]